MDLIIIPHIFHSLLFIFSAFHIPLPKGRGLTMLGEHANGVRSLTSQGGRGYKANGSLCTKLELSICRIHKNGSRQMSSFFRMVLAPDHVIPSSILLAVFLFLNFITILF